MSSRLRISLVIPAYNEESHLLACLQSALAQTLPFHEIIVVDNNSSDTTGQLARSFDGVTVLKEAKKGIVFARNRGFNAASGDIIARIDADTILPTDWAEHIITFYSDETHLKTAWTCGGSFYNVPFSRFVSFGYNSLAFFTNRLLTGYPTLWGSSTALPKKAWQDVKDNICIRTDIHEDLDLTTHLERRGIAIFYDKNMKVMAELRHAYASRRELWKYLQWWPQTLKIHQQKTWVLCWLIGVIPLFIATSGLVVLDYFLRSLTSLAARIKSQVLSALDV